MSVSATPRMDLKEAARYVAKTTGAPTPHTATLLRWIKRGVRGRQLRAEPVGMRWFTSPEDIDTFLREQAAAASTPTMSAGPMRQGQVGKAMNELDELLETTAGRPQKRGAK